MRKIKFRAWNGKTMVPDVGIFGGRVVDSASRMYDTPNMEIEEIEKAIPMQFTGLLDRKGVEVYEGDIVCIVEDKVAEVIEGYERFEPEGRICEILWKDAAWFAGDEMLWEWSSDCEIIGDIHRNPELLASPRPIGESA